jgi:hypothetical protein
MEMAPVLRKPKSKALGLILNGKGEHVSREHQRRNIAMALEHEAIARMDAREAAQ